MSKRKLSKLTAVILCATMAIGIPVYASSTREAIEQTTQEQEETREEIVLAQARISDLQVLEGNAEAYLAELNSQLEQFTYNLQILQEQYDAKQSELVMAEQELEASRQQEAEQYENMKLRIQYMYESSTGAGALESLFSGEDFMDFLNRADAMSQVSQYDREMLEAYQQTRLAIEQKEAQIQAEYQSLSELRDQMLAQRMEAAELYENGYQEYLHIKEELAGAQAEEAALLDRFENLDSQLNGLIAQEMEEQKAAEAEQAAKAARDAQAARAAQQATAQTVAAAQPPASAQSAAQTESTEVSGNMRYLGRFTLTAYCPCRKCCGKWASGITASGVPATEGTTVAMGGVPFGTKLMINGHVYTVQDRGTPYGHVDIFFSTHSQALSFGMKSAEVYIIE